MPDSDLLTWLSSVLIRSGPGVLFVACLLETAIFAGLIVPVGGLIAFSAMLSSRGIFSPAEIIAAAFFGALIGDQLGFAVGRWFIANAQPPRGKVSQVWASTLVRADTLIRERGAFGVSVGRAIPFLRTIMPWFAGRSGLAWGRFFFFDLVGVIIWGTIYIGGGFLAGESWRQVAGRYGEEAGAGVAIVLILAFLLLSRQSLLNVFRRRSTEV
ncbi:MAG: hypothetical protein GEU90_19765 [Gemmatimonas sp.]|nr:hypothetical protein [Gemmatimonas sp.]